MSDVTDLTCREMVELVTDYLEDALPAPDRVRFETINPTFLLAVTKAAESFCDGVSQDIPIWENKVYRERPVLTRSERPIIDHRRWARQFYSDYDAADEVTDTEA